MRKLLILLFLLVNTNWLFGQTRYWVAGSAANWSGDNWAASSGGAADGGGPPADAELARFDANGLGNCTLDLASDSITGIFMNGYTGILDLNGNTLISSGTSTLTTGTINDTPTTGEFRINGGVTVTMNGTTFGALVNVTANNITLSGSTFNAEANFIKDGTGGNTGTGNNVFNGKTTFTHTGAGGNWAFGNTNPDDFNDSLIISTTGSGAIFLSNASTGNTFDGHVVVNCTGSATGVYFGNSNGTSTLSSGNTITVGSLGFTTSNLRLRNFTQSGGTAQNITTGGTTTLLDIYDCSFSGAVTFSSPRFTTRGTSYASTADITKTDASNDASVGGNIFDNDVAFTNTGSGYILMANTVADTFRTNVTLDNSGSSLIYIANNVTGSYIGGNLTGTNTGSGSNASLVLSNGNSAGLTIEGNVSITNTPSATAGHVYIGNSGDITINGDVTITNNGTGTTHDVYIANNVNSAAVINGVTHLTNSGATTTSRIYVGNNGDATLGDSLYLINESSANNSQIYCHNTSNSTNIYNGSIVVENTDAVGDGVYFGVGNGSGTLASGENVSIGSGGFTGASQLYIRNLTQNGSQAINLTTTGTTLTTLYDCNIGGNFSLTSPRLSTRGTTYGGTTYFEKNGATDDQSVGGNTFTGNSEFVVSGSGYILLGNGSADVFGGDLTVTNSGTRHFYLAFNGAGNTIAGNLNMTNSGSGTSNYIYVSSASASTLTITGTVNLINSSSSTDGRIIFGDQGDVTCNSSFTIDQSGTGTTNQYQIANSATSEVIINGVARMTNSASGTTARLWIGNQGDMTFNDSLIITSSTGSTNSEALLNYNSNSSNTYNGPIVLTCTNASGDGVYFGSASGQGTLASGQTITIGGGGYIATQIYFRNFTQLGATAQSLHPTGTTLFTLYDCTWNGNVDFSSSRINTRGTTYNGTATLEKTGATDDASTGGNVFAMDANINNSGSGYVLLANTVADSFMANLTMTNTGTYHMYLGNSVAGNYVGGNLVVNNSTSGTNSHIYLSNNTACSITIDGSLTATNSSSADNTYIYVGNNGDVSIGTTGDLTNSTTGLNGGISVAHGSASEVSFGGRVNASNSGGSTTKYFYLGNSGDATFGDSLNIANSSSATNSSVFLQHASSSVNVYNGDITMEVTDASCDGILFGQNGGSGTLASGQTISITSNGFIAGQLYLRNFTQVGATAQTLQPTSTTIMTVYDCSWGGDIIFSSPRITTRGTTYSGTLNLEKTGATDDASAGGNNITGVCVLTNSGSGYLLMGNGTADVFGSHLTMNNTGSYNMYLAYNSAGNSVGGDLTVNHSTSGTSSLMSLSSVSASTLTVTGNTVINYNSSATTSTLNVGDQGDITFTGSLTINGTSTSTTVSAIIASNSNSLVTIGTDLVMTNGGASGTTHRMYVTNNGTVTIGGNMTLTNSSNATTAEMYVANGTVTSVSITGNSTVTNSGTGASTTRVYLGNNGDITFGGTLDITNSSNSTNSQVYCNQTSNSSNNYNGNITLETTHADCDGIYFGGSSGSGTLAATRTITIGGGGFIAGNLYLRNFTQVGATDQILQPTGSTIMTVYDCSWGGNITFSSPRISTRGTVYSGNLDFEKTDATNDASVGGNSVAGNCILTCSGSGYLLMGNGSADTFGGDVTMNNTGSNNMYLAHNSAGNTVAGNLVVNNSSSGSATNIYLSTSVGSTLTITGTATINHSSTATTAVVYVGDQGDIDFDSTLTINSTSTATTSTVLIANNSNSQVSVDGALVMVNGGASGTAHRMYAGNSGDLTLASDLTLTNSTSATTGEIYIGNGSSSALTIPGNTTVTNSGTGATTTRIYLGNAGDVTFGGDLDIVNSSNSTNSQVYANFSSTSVNAYNGNITMQVTDANCDGIGFGSNGGSGTLAATRTISIGGGGFVAGILYLRNFTQVGATAQTLQPTGTTIMTIYDASWGGDVVFTSPQFSTRGTAYSGTAYLEKTGSTNNNSSGGNTFTGNCELVNSGSGYFLMGNGTADVFNANLDMTVTGSNHLYLAYNSAGNTIAGQLNATNSSTSGNANIYVSSISNSTLTVTGAATFLNQASGTSGGMVVGDQGDITFDSTLTFISTNTSSSGDCYLGNNALSSISVAGDAILTNGGTGGTTKRFYVGNNADITFSGKVTLTNSSTATTAQLLIANSSNSSIIAVDSFLVYNSGTGSSCQTYLGNAGDMTLNGFLGIYNSSSSNSSLVYCNHTSNSVNAYNGSIEVENTNANGDGIVFGNGNGSATLASGQTITVGAGGFANGLLYFRNFDQLGTTAQSITLTGTATLTIYDATWGGNVDFASPRISTRGSTYSGTASLNKTGAVNDASTGGNTFDGEVTFTNSGTGYFLHANSQSDDYNGDVNYIKTSTGLLYPAYNTTCTFAGNINFNTNTAVSLALAAGTVEFDGSGAQSINDLASTVEPIFRRILLNNSADEVTLNTPITVSTSADFTAGNIITTESNLLTFNDNSTVSNASDASYVDGPVEKVGNDAFTFPVGDSGSYRPISMSAPSSGSAAFRGTYFQANPGDTWDPTSLDPGLNWISSIEYWTLDRISSTNNVTVTLTWGANSGVNDLTDLAVVRWDTTGTIWSDHGNGGTTGDSTAGTIATSGAVTSFSPFTFASTNNNNNPLPIELISFEARNGVTEVDLFWSTATEINNDYFTVERTMDGENFEVVGMVDGAGNSSTTLSYSLVDPEPLDGVSYYRLKQTDFNGDFSYSELEVITRNLEFDWKLFPNPNTGNHFIISPDPSWKMMDLQVIDLNGRIRHQDKVDFSAGAQQIRLVHALEAGVYTVRISSPAGFDTVRLVVQ